jgi:hypothetical protein
MVSTFTNTHQVGLALRTPPAQRTPPAHNLVPLGLALIVGVGQLRLTRVIIHQGE